MRPRFLRSILQLLQHNRQRQLLQSLLQLHVPTSPMFYLQLGSDPRTHGPRQRKLCNRTHLRAPTHRHLPPMVSSQQRRPASLPRRQQQEHLRQLHQPNPLRPRPAMDRHHLWRRRQHQNRRQPTHRRAHESNVRRDSHQRTRLPRNPPERPQSATLRRQHPLHHDHGRRPTGPRRRILRAVPLPPRPQRVRHFQSRLRPRQDLLRETGPSLRTRRQGSVCRERAVAK